MSVPELSWAGWTVLGMLGVAVVFIIIGESHTVLTNRRRDRSGDENFETIDARLDSLEKRLELAGIAGPYAMPDEDMATRPNITEPQPRPDETGPIQLVPQGDRPSWAQQANPTRPDLAAQHPKPSGATRYEPSAGRHRAPEPQETKR